MCFEGGGHQVQDPPLLEREKLEHPPDRRRAGRTNLTKFAIGPVPAVPEQTDLRNSYSMNHIRYQTARHVSFDDQPQDILGETKQVPPRYAGHCRDCAGVARSTLEK